MRRFGIVITVAVLVASCSTSVTEVTPSLDVREPIPAGPTATALPRAVPTSRSPEEAGDATPGGVVRNDAVADVAVDVVVGVTPWGGRLACPEPESVVTMDTGGTAGADEEGVLSDAEIRSQAGEFIAQFITADVEAIRLIETVVDDDGVVRAVFGLATPDADPVDRSPLWIQAVVGSRHLEPEAFAICQSLIRDE